MSQAFDSRPKPKMQVDRLVFSARNGRFAEKIVPLTRLTVVKSCAENTNCGAHRRFPAPGEKPQSPDHRQCLGAARVGQVSPDGTVTQFCKSSSFLFE